MASISLKTYNPYISILHIIQVIKPSMHFMIFVDSAFPYFPPPWPICFKTIYLSGSAEPRLRPLIDLKFLTTLEGFREPCTLHKQDQASALPSPSSGVPGFIGEAIFEARASCKAYSAKSHKKRATC